MNSRFRNSSLRVSRNSRFGNSRIPKAFLKHDLKKSKIPREF